MSAQHQYAILWACKAGDLEKMVVDQLNKGWRLAGGVTFDNQSQRFFQAVTREVPPTLPDAPKQN